MCRLFGFRSVFEAQVHRSLLETENALNIQSQRHPDGWGVAYYVQGVPHVIKSPTQALQDQIFHKVSGVVTSQTVLAHIRNSTQGANGLLNTHPFQFGPWVFAHNGNIKNFAQHKTKLTSLIRPEWRPFLLGDTDSETLFFILLSEIQQQVDPHTSELSFNKLKLAIAAALKNIVNIVGPYCKKDDGKNTETYLTFLLTNGKIMVGHHGGQPLQYSTHKSRCPSRDSCNYFSENCESKSSSKEQVNHLLLASEPLLGENIWSPLTPGDLVGIDHRMNFYKESLLETKS